MKIFSYVATGLVVLAAPLAANAFSFDEFGDAQGPVTDSVIGGGINFGSYTDVTAGNTDVANLIRRLGAERTGGSAGSLVGVVSAAVDGGAYSHSQNDNTQGKTYVDWCIGAAQACAGSADLSAWKNMTLQVKVLSQDLIGTAAVRPTMTVELIFGATVMSTVITLDQRVQGAPVNDPPAFYNVLFSSFSGYDPNVWNNFTGARMTIDGSAIDSLDLSLDFIRTPEPGSLALLGLGLIGLGLARRRSVK